MRGYFGVGVERVSKPRNVGALFRTAHAFGAGFVFTVGAVYDTDGHVRADTSKTPGQLPFYSFPDLDHLVLPEGCSLVGVELTDDAIDLPSFHHPRQAVYILGPERGNLSARMTERCDHVIKIPTKFCINVSLAGALVMYDRVLSLGRFASRPMRPGGPTESLPDHVAGGPVIRSKMDPYLDAPPAEALEAYDSEGE